MNKNILVAVVILIIIIITGWWIVNLPPAPEIELAKPAADTEIPDASQSTTSAIKKITDPTATPTSASIPAAKSPIPSPSLKSQTPPPSPLPATNPTPAPTPTPVSQTPPPPPAPPATVSVSISNFAFSPSTITVKKGTIVKWTNNDSAPHTVTGISIGPVSDTLLNGQTYSYTFDTIGSFDYNCGFHSSMTGRVVVTE